MPGANIGKVGETIPVEVVEGADRELLEKGWGWSLGNKVVEVEQRGVAGENVAGVCRWKRKMGFAENGMGMNPIEREGFNGGDK